MWTIEAHEKQAFEDQRVHKFEHEMVAHLREFAPHHAKIMTDDAMFAVIRRGILRAKKYGMTQRGPVRFYLDMMWMFGSDFDQDPQLPWASAILNDESVSPNREKVSRLHGSMEGFLTQVAGEENQYALQALQRARQLNINQWTTAVDMHRSVESVALKLMRHVYPQKYDYVTEERLRMMLRVAHKYTQTYSKRKPRRHFFIVAGLMYTMGTHVMTDPLHPWVQKTLNKEHFSAHKIDRLYERSQVYLASVLKHLM